MKFIAKKTEDGAIKGKISFYCAALKVSRQGFYDYLDNRNRAWKYEHLAELIKEVIAEDECNDTYERGRMYAALNLKYPDEKIPGERTVYRVMERIGADHPKRRKPNGITKADREARKSDDLLKRDFQAEKPFEKCVTDITEIPAKDGKLYVSAIFDCFDASVLGLSMDDNMRAELCVQTIENACGGYPDMRGAVLHSDRGSQYTSEKYRAAIANLGIRQSMNSSGGRCHDNARCESMWARMKDELFYLRDRDPKAYTIDELKTLVWRYFMSYWNNRRICSAIGGMPLVEKRRGYYAALNAVA
ncbi:MAG: IS3 family transposase [Oscillospiraceae bacterium]|nr:IS3 family transposase [Oscillospiraceae bacterium]